MPCTHRDVIRTAVLLFGATLAACSDVAGTARVPVALSVAGPGAPAASAVAPSAALRSVTISSGTNTLVITRAQIVLARIELDRTGSAPCATSDDDGECEELKLDPMLVDLPVTQTLQQEFTVTVPAGSYASLEAKIRAPRSGEDRTAAFLAAHPEFAGKSVHVEGTFNGTPFTYDGNAEGELELAFDPPLTVTDGATNNITLHVDLSTWFRDGSGNVVDPSSSANASLIVQNIRRSFHAFEDDDRNGVDDHGAENHGSDG